jgi:hypothetical protein
MTQPQPFDVTDGPKPGSRIANNGTTQVALLDADGRVFRRRGVRVSGGEAQAVEWAVVELGGVRVYVDGTSVIVTRRDIHP